MRRAAYSPTCYLAAAFLAFLLLPALTARADVNARTSLDRDTPAVKLDAVTFKDALDFVQDLSGANLHVNWAALQAAGVTKDAVVDVHVRGVPLRKVLTLILSEAAAGNTTLTYYIDDNVIEITTLEMADKVMLTIVYPVDDLLMDIPDFTDAPTFDLTQSQSNSSGTTVGAGGGGSGSSGGNLFSGGSGSGGSQSSSATRAQRAQALVDLITTIVRPEIWTTNGGPASIRFFNGSLIVTAPRSVQEAISGP
jgi:uncharacterized membrane protein YgcG